MIIIQGDFFLIGSALKSSFNQSGYRGLDAISQIGVVRTLAVWVCAFIGLRTNEQ